MDGILHIEEFMEKELLSLTHEQYIEELALRNLVFFERSS